MSGIYLHIPFCKQACHYCDFHFSTSLKKKEEMIEAIVKELQLRKDEHKEVVETIYFGGGTPSILTKEELQLLLDTIHSNYKVSEHSEITLEANPDDLLSVRAESRTSVFKDYKDIGINRLSIGIQSFFEDDLKLMNRAHNAKEAEACLVEATQYFDNISIDLIYGMPNMNNAKWEKNIEKALSFKVPHVSSYALTVEPKTVLANFIKKGTITPVEDEVTSAHFNILVNKLTKAGYVCYEVSNFGKSGFFSKHNTSYWQGKNYLGIGPSAHSFNGKQRGWNVKNNTKYIKSIMEGELPIEVEELSIMDQYNEYVMTGLRTIWGVSLSKIQSNFGEKYHNYILKEAKNHIENGTLKIEKNLLFTTDKGKFLSDGLSSSLFMVN